MFARVLLFVLCLLQLFVTIKPAQAQTTASHSAPYKESIATLFPSRHSSQNIHTVYFESFNIIIVFHNNTLYYAFFVPTAPGSISEADLEQEVEAFVSLLYISGHDIHRFNPIDNRCFVLSVTKHLPSSGSISPLERITSKTPVQAMLQLSDNGARPPIAWVDDAPVWKLEPINKSPVSVTFSLNSEFISSYFLYIDKSRPTVTKLYQYLKQISGVSFTKTSSSTALTLRGLRLVGVQEPYISGALNIASINNTKDPYIYAVSTRSQLQPMQNKSLHELLALTYPKTVELSPSKKLIARKNAANTSATATANASAPKTDTKKSSFTKSSAKKAWLEELNEL